MRRTLTWLAATVGVIAALLTLAILVLDWNMLRGPISQWVSEETGREFAIDGDLEGSISMHPWFTARDIRLANADWASEPDMLRVERLDVRFDLGALLRGQTVITDLRVHGAEVHLEAADERRVNWDLDTEERPDEPPQIPLIETLVIDESRLTYRDHGREFELDARLSSVEAVSPDEGALPVTLEGQGRIQGEPFELNIRGAALVNLRDTDEPYAIELDAQVGPTELAMAGTLLHRPDQMHLDMDLHLAGPDLALLVPILHIPLPATPPYELAGHLVRENDLWRFEDFDGTVGESDLSGLVTFDAGPERPLITADLLSRNLQFEDLGAVIGVSPDLGEGEAEDRGEAEDVDVDVDEAEDETEPAPRVLPDAPLQVEQIQENDVRLTFRGERVVARGLPLNDVELDLEIEEGILRLSPLRFGLAGGAFDLFTSIYSGGDTVQTDYDLRLSGIQLRDIIEGTPMDGYGEGVLEGRALFSTTGDTIRSALATADGEVAIIMERGRIDGSLLRLLDIGFLEALTLVRGDTVPDAVHIRCFVAAFDSEDGVMNSTILLLDTEDTMIAGDGEIDLNEETFVLDIKGEPKETGIARTRVPVRVSGPFTAPSIDIDPSELVVRGGLAVGLAALVSPIAAVAAFFDLGQAEDSDCLRLHEESMPDE
ncbi:AsmA family protein [Thioalkalivibrio sp. ALMg11]|uniref:AsmA family protein n=1 Tax=Thioalkalivibrio sp. ALMg11 TaxID=1158165 RepID=UPI0005B5424A|nr:AsmA family protein [Thioalkalivibrio sp. ALMg11]